MITSEPPGNRPERRTVAPTPQLRRLGQLIAGASILAIGAATLTSQTGQPETSPFCIICGSLGGVDSVLNILLFLPLGVGLGLAGARIVPALLAMGFLSVGIELAQLTLISGRDANIGDVLTNVLGGILGFILAHRFELWRRPSRRAALALCACWSAIWLTIQLLSSYAFVPALPASRYYGQIARQFANMATFGGKVISATIDTVTVPDFGFAKTDQFHLLLERGATVGAIVVPAGPTSGIAPILRVADDRRREIVLLAQNRSDLVFGLRTAAATLRLRPPLFRLGGAFPSGGDGAKHLLSDTLRLRVRYSVTRVEMRVDSRPMAHRRDILIYPSLSWTFVLPAQWYVEGTSIELWLSLIWLGLQTILFGYWGGFLVASGRADVARSSSSPGVTWSPAIVAWSLAIVALIAVLTLGLTVLPRAFGLAPAAFAAWLAVVSAVLLGLAVGRTQREP